MTTLANAGPPKKGIKDIIEVKRHGEALVIPEGLSLERADEAIHARIAFEKEVVAIHAPIAAPFPFEAAYALFEILNEKFGWANSKPGTTMLSVPVGPNESVQVPWGPFELPNVDGTLATSIEGDDLGVARFVISGKVKRMYEKVVTELVEAVKDRVRHRSIYKGKAFRVRLFDDRGRRIPMPEPKFLDLEQRVADELILPEHTAESVQTNIFTLIEQTERVTRKGIPLKRGILLAGPFGTGKTMIARVTAERAVDNGWTYVEVERIGEFAEVARMVQPYGDQKAGVVLFCEDIDRIMAGDDRHEGIDMVLNVIDGVESKGSAMMVVLTTNDLDGITSAMLRPGRLDAIIPVLAPDGDAAVRLARQYGRGTIAEDDPMTESRELLAGNIPAVIREAVERSKLRVISRTKDGDPEIVTDADLAAAAREMANHIQLLTPAEPDKRSEVVKAAEVLAEAAREGHPVLSYPLIPAHGVADDSFGGGIYMAEPGARPESQAKNGKTGKPKVRVADDSAN